MVVALERLPPSAARKKKTSGTFLQASRFCGFRTLGAWMPRSALDGARDTAFRGQVPARRDGLSKIVGARGRNRIMTWRL